MNKKEIFFHLLRNNELTIKRIANASKCFLSYLLKKPKVAGYPPILMIEPTNYCNLQCPLCPTGNGSLKAPRGFMKFEDYKKVIDECGDYLLNLTLWNFGESFLNKEVYNMLDYAKKKNIFIRISTNGHLFNNKEHIKRLVKSRIDNLIISLDGASQETFSKYRKNGNFSQVINNVKEIIKEKNIQKSRYPLIEIQFIIMKHNEHEIPKMKELAKEIGADKLTFKTLSFGIDQALNDRKIEEFMPKDEKYSRYNKKDGKIEQKAEIKNKCQWLWIASVINWDGSMSPCCYDPNRKISLGNVFKKESFMKIWNNEEYQKLRQKVLENKKSIDICEKCPGMLFGRTLN